MTTPNRQHAQDILDYIKAHPEEHEQYSWVQDPNDISPSASPETGCGTTMCLAGTSVFLTEGPRGLKKIYTEIANNEVAYLMQETDDLIDEDDIFVQKGADNLGLDYHEANELFTIMSNETAVNAMQALADGDMATFRVYLNYSIRHPDA